MFDAVNLLMLCFTLCPAFLIAIPSAMQWSITVAQISSEITVLCSLLWQLPSSTTLNTHCSLYNLQLLALSKLAYIGVLASIATRVNNFKLLHLHWHATFATYACHYATQSASQFQFSHAFRVPRDMLMSWWVESMLSITLYVCLLSKYYFMISTTS